MKNQLRTHGALILCLALIFMVAGCAKKTAPVGALETQQPAASVAQQEAPAFTPLAEEVKVEATQAELQQFEAEKIFFEYDKSDLRPEAREVLEKKADWLKRYSALAIRIEGHCDERGTTEYNLALGERRAKAAYDYLVSLGIEPSRLTIISYGEERPGDPGHNEAAWAKNRRDEFKVKK